MNLHLLGWAWLHDVDENDHIGLIKRDRTEKLAYEAWKTFQLLENLPKNRVSRFTMFSVFLNLEEVAT